jgi:sulfatase modifying factor 1
MGAKIVNWEIAPFILGCVVVLGGTSAVQSAGTPDDMVLVPGGYFEMGSPKGWHDNETPQHQVYVDSFYMDKYLVTNKDFQKFVKATGYVTDAEKNGGGKVYKGFNGFVLVPSANWKDPLGDGKGIQGKMDNPVVQVNWYDACSFAEWVGKRLPTEAEYEKAAGGGVTTQYYFGNDAGQLGDYEWYSHNSGWKTHPVGVKKPNPYGLYDILGNVFEWCSDWYGDDYYAVSSLKNPQGPKSGKNRVIRGGSWVLNSDDYRPAFRLGDSPYYGDFAKGFRCASTP